VVAAIRFPGAPTGEWAYVSVIRKDEDMPKTYKVKWDTAKTTWTIKEHKPEKPEEFSSVSRT
jgi:hypothetical protein